MTDRELELSEKEKYRKVAKLLCDRLHKNWSDFKKNKIILLSSRGTLYAFSKAREFISMMDKTWKSLKYLWLNKANVLFTPQGNEINLVPLTDVQKIQLWKDTFHVSEFNFSEANWTNICKQFDVGVTLFTRFAPDYIANLVRFIGTESDIKNLALFAPSAVIRSFKEIPQELEHTFFINLIHRLLYYEYAIVYEEVKGKRQPLFIIDRDINDTLRFTIKYDSFLNPRRTGNIERFIEMVFQMGEINSIGIDHLIPRTKIQDALLHKVSRSFEIKSDETQLEDRYSQPIIKSDDDLTIMLKVLYDFLSTTRGDYGILFPRKITSGGEFFGQYKKIFSLGDSSSKRTMNMKVFDPKIFNHCMAPFRVRQKKHPRVDLEIEGKDVHQCTSLPFKYIKQSLDNEELRKEWYKKYTENNSFLSFWLSQHKTYPGYVQKVIEQQSAPEDAGIPVIIDYPSLTGLITLFDIQGKDFNLFITEDTFMERFENPYMS
jgi:hypothetical protein